MMRAKTTCAVTLLWVIFLGAWVTTTRAQRPNAPDRLSRSRLWRESRRPPQPIVVWHPGRTFSVSQRHWFGRFHGPGVAYPLWSRFSYYWYPGVVTPYFYSTPVPDIYTYAEAVSVPSRPVSERSEWVAEWQDRDPGEKRPNHDMSQSLLLKKDMSEVEILQAVGSPIERRRTAEGEIWKYSSYTLVIEAGKLKAMH